ncbi:hypothetical protein [Nocardia cyriacigeorgica]|uniref:hypothetical protein n=1 Tax=Nocardia cyriacigeorgica TaxID=135487 RepID=UPI002453D93A|nr:hypothetical protein [Nocardia cyriacigeorgica]
MPLPELTPHEREIDARECDAIAEHLDRLAEIHDGSLALYLARQHRADAAAIRARAGRHREIAANGGRPPEED